MFVLLNVSQVKKADTSICTCPTAWYVVTYLVEELCCSCGSLADLHRWTTPCGRVCAL